MIPRSPIFIGSSSEQRRLAGRIADELGDLGLQILPWWDKKVFRPGDVTLNRLIQLTGLCDAAVLIFGGEKDMVWSRGVLSEGVRDNVLLEYGLFLGACDLQHTVIVCEKDAKRPSDLDGVTVIFKKRRDTHDSVAQAVAEHFRHLLQAEEREFQSKPSLVLHVDWSMQLHAMVPIDYPHWSLASLYSGLRGALAWRDVEYSPAYRERVQTEEGGAQIGGLVGKRKVNTVVSLGPGAGSVDVEVMANLSVRQWREYIPVDVNRYLLLESARRVTQENGRTWCARGVLCDFDTNISFVGDVVKRYSKGPRLFLMAGGTFGNSGHTESALLGKLYEIMGEDDLFVFDLFCWTDTYDEPKDPLYDLSGDAKGAIRTFFANGVRMLRGELSLTDDEALQHAEVKATSGSLPGTRGIVWVESESNTTIVRIRRFLIDEITAAISEAGFKIVPPGKVSTGMLERHILLASK